MTAVTCEKGPWDGRSVENFSAVPSRRVPVYAVAACGASVCADEQVIARLGFYVRWREECGYAEPCERHPGGFRWVYLWTTNPNTLEW